MLKCSSELYRLAGVRGDENVWDYIISHAKKYPLDVTWEDGHGDNTLHRLCRSNNPPVGVLLAVVAANRNVISVQNFEGWTPLQFACSSGNLSDEAVLALIDAFPGAVLISGSNGWNPFHHACDNCSSITILRRMLQVDPSLVLRAEGDTGRQPLDIMWSGIRRKTGKMNNNVSAPFATAATSNCISLELRSCIKRMDYLLRMAYHRMVVNPLLASSKNKTWLGLHAAVMMKCPVDYINLILKIFPEQASERNGGSESATNVSLPLAIAIQTSNSSTQEYSKLLFDSLLQINPHAARTKDGDGRLPLHVALEKGMTWEHGGVEILWKAFPEALYTRDIKTHMYPFMLAAVAVTGLADYESKAPCDVSLDTIYELLLAAPEFVKIAVSTDS